MEEETKQVIQELGAWLDRVSVSGDSVDYLAMARQTYRKLRATLSTVPPQAQEEEGTHG